VKQLRLSLSGFAVLSAILVVSPARAQTATHQAEPAFATIDGFAVDSLNNGVLRGAMLSIDGVSTLAFTDSLGRFHVDSVPPGTRRVHVIHPTLDSLGIALQTQPLQLTAGEKLSLVIATPSVATVLSSRCTNDERRVGPAALIGTVLFESNDAPAKGAQVALEWTELRVSEKKIQPIPVRRVATVADNGQFKVCGLPDELNGTLTAFNGRDSTGIMRVRLSSLLGVMELRLPEPLSARQPTAALTGRVVGPDGAPLSRARISVGADPGFASTDTVGRFVLNNVRSGTRPVRVRKLGFEPVEIPVSLQSNKTVDVTVKLKRSVVVLDTVRVMARRETALAGVGFFMIKQINSGFFITPDQMDNRHSFSMANMLASAPMLRIDYSTGRAVVTGRPIGDHPGCVNWYVDGVPWRGGDIEEYVTPEEIAAVEVYSGIMVPSQFQDLLADCSTVVLWTKWSIH
jgi:hypothetical protein